MKNDRLANVAILDPDVGEDDMREITDAIEGRLIATRTTHGDGWAAVALPEGLTVAELEGLASLAGVARLASVHAPYRLVSREMFGSPVPVRVGGPAATDLSFGGEGPIGLVVGSRWGMASEARLALIAPLLADAGCCVLHVGRFTASPKGESGTVDQTMLRHARTVGDEHGLALCVEVTDAGNIAVAEELADILLVGSHNMQDFGLLRDLGRAGLPVILRRGSGATVEEFLLAAEYIVSHGNGRVILCESGIRTFDSAARARFEINAIPLIRQLSHLPLVADPCAATAHSRLVPGVARAAVAAGADGLVLEVGGEVTNDPGDTAIDVVTLQRLITELRPVVRAVGRTLHGTGREDLLIAPRSSEELLRITDRTLGLTIETIIGVAPELEVVAQWRHRSPAPSLLAASLSESEILARATSYRLGGVRLSRNLAYVDLSRIDPTLAILLESSQVNLGQLFLDPRIEKRTFSFGTERDAGEIDAILRARFPAEEDLPSYVWRRYEGVIDGETAFVVIECLPADTWRRLLDRGPAFVVHEKLAG